MNNIFKNACFNKLYKTKDGRQATFIGWDDMMQHAFLYVKERDMEFYGEATYELDGTTLGGSTPHDIVSEWNLENKITINVPSDKIAQQTTDENGNIIIKFVDPEPIKSKSWREFCGNHPDISQEYQLDSNGGVALIGWSNHRRWVENRHLLQTEEDAEGILTLIQLTRLHDEWVGDWKREDSLKLDDCIPYAIKGDGQSYDVIESSCHNILEFPSPEMADEFLECFRDLIEKAKKFI